jgi:hypothetical protein
VVQSLLNRAAVSTVRRGGNEEVAGEAAASSAATVNKKQPLNNVKRDMQQQLSSAPGRRAISHRPDRGAGCLRCGAAVTNAVHSLLHHRGSAVCRFTAVSLQPGSECEICHLSTAEGGGSLKSERRRARPAAVTGVARARAASRGAAPLPLDLRYG